jgi:hypothetical protein
MVELVALVLHLQSRAHLSHVLVVVVVNREITL